MAENAIPVEELAERLAAAEVERRTIPKLVTEFPDLDADAAYEIQRVGFARKLAAGDTQIGYKVGLSSRAKQASVGVAEPVRGRLAASMVHPEENPLDLTQLVHPRAEAEIAFLLGEDLSPGRVSVPAVLGATAGVFPALEILDSRYDRFEFTHRDAIADNTSAARVVLGGRLLPPDRLDVRLEGMVLRVDGEIVQTGAGAAVSGHPAAAVGWLAAAVGGLSAGDVVLSGGLTAAVPLAGVRSLIAEYTNLGTVGLVIGRGDEPA